MIDGERHFDTLLVGGGVLQFLVVLGLFARPSVVPVGIGVDLGWPTLALIQSGLLLGVVIWGAALQADVRSIRLRLSDLEAPGQRSSDEVDG